VTVHGFAVASLTVGGDVTGSGPVAAVAGCWGGEGFSLLAFPNSIFWRCWSFCGASRAVQPWPRFYQGSDQVTAIRPFSRDGLAAALDRR